jgi:hypothetical protein
LFKDKKDHYYPFGPSDELVQTLPFEFVANLKGGAYTRLPSKWMSNIQSKLNQSQRNLITSIQLVRSLRPSNNLGGIFLLTVEPDKNNCYIYKVFMEKSSFFLSHGQIYEIIGDGLWMDSEINCLCNVASGRKIWLTLGSKRNSVDPMEINIGDWVAVSNHGNLFPRAQVKEIDFSKNLTKVNWENSCITDVVEIANLHPYSTSTTSKQKRIKTDFFHHHNNQRYKTTANDEQLCDKQTVSEVQSLYNIIHLKIHNNSALKDL